MSSSAGRYSSVRSRREQIIAVSEEANSAALINLSLICERYSTRWTSLYTERVCQIYLVLYCVYEFLDQFRVDSNNFANNALFLIAFNLELADMCRLWSRNSTRFLAHSVYTVGVYLIKDKRIKEFRR